MLKTETYRPRTLDKFITSFDYYELDSSSKSIFYFSLLPNGRVHILFQFDSQVAHNTSFSKGWENRPDIFIGGPYDRAYQMELKPASKIFSVTFEPAMSKYFFDCPISELKNQLVHPSVLWGSEFNDIVYQLEESNSNQSRANILEDYLIKRYKDKKLSAIEAITREVVAKGGCGKTELYADKANLSNSRYRKVFNDEVGLSPKEFQKLVRIEAICEFYQKHPSVSFTTLAYRFGYWDQSHFIKEFRSITGHAPKTYLQNRRFLQF